jgi:hypothetical protein
MRNKLPRPRTRSTLPDEPPEPAAVYVAPGVRRFIPRGPVLQDGWLLSDFDRDDAEYGAEDPEAC